MAKTETLQIRVTAEDKAFFDAAASKAERTRSDWIVKVAREAARRELAEDAK